MNAKHYAADQLPIGTSNTALALALYIAGAKFADEETPLTNTYDSDILRGLGLGGNIEQAVLDAVAQGKHGHVEYGFARTTEFGHAQRAFDAQQLALKSLEQPARLIVLGIQERWQGGQLTSAEAMAAATCVILKRWRDELKEWEGHRTFSIQKSLNASKNFDARELAERVFARGDFYSFAAVILDARKVFLNLWKNYPPNVRLRFQGKGPISTKKTPDGGRVEKHGRFVLYSTNAEQETRRHLGIKPR